MRQKKVSSVEISVEYFELEDGVFFTASNKKNKIINFPVCNLILFIIYYKVTGIFLWDENQRILCLKKFGRQT